MQNFDRRKRPLSAEQLAAAHTAADSLDDTMLSRVQPNVNMHKVHALLGTSAMRELGLPVPRRSADHDIAASASSVADAPRARRARNINITDEEHDLAMQNALDDREMDDRAPYLTPSLVKSMTLPIPDELSEHVAIDAFAGAGGYTLGAAAANVDTVIALDNNNDVLQLVDAHLRIHTTLGDDVMLAAEAFELLINGMELLKHPSRTIVVHLSPPCQPLSASNTSRSNSTSLTVWCLELVSVLKSKYGDRVTWTLEQVRPILCARARMFLPARVLATCLRYRTAIL